MPLVKAVQELSKQNDSLKTNDNIKFASLQKQIDDLKAIITGTNSSAIVDNKVSAQVVELGMQASLKQNVPNPFNGQTNINYFLPVNNGNAYITFITTDGQTLKSVKLAGNGNGTITLKASELPSSAYKYALIIDGRIIDTKSMILSK